MEERRTNIGNSCDLYDKCFSMHTGWDLFAREITQTKKKLIQLQESEDQAQIDRKQTSEKVDMIHDSFKEHIKDEMEVQKEHIKTTKEHTKVLGELSEVIKDMREDHKTTKETLDKEVIDTSWIKKFGYGVSALFGMALLTIFLHLNATDKTMTKIETNLERNTEVLNELKDYFRGGSK